MPRRTTSTRASGASASELAAAAQRLAAQLGSLAEEIASLRTENATLRSQLESVVKMLDDAAVAIGERRRATATEGEGTTRRRRKPLGRRRTRVTPEGVTPAVVLATIGKIGRPATAAEIAAEISRHGFPVSGRAIRFLAERAGARVEVDEQGQRRYAV